MVNRIISVGDDFTLPASVKTADANLPAASKAAAVAAQVAAAVAPKLDASQKGAASGVAPLGADSRVAESNLPAGLATAALNATFASQFTATGTTTAAEVTAWLAVPYKGVKRLTGALTISAPITIPSDTSLDASGAVITSTHVGNMIRNTNYASTTLRDKNITISGGTWQRNAGGVAGAGVKGDSNGSHSIFLRRVDGLIVRDLLVGSTGGKYMVALGSITNFHVADITTQSVASDTVHITGPANAGVIERVRTMSGGDDVVAFTTTDYTGYNDVSGTIQNITVRDVVANNSTRAVLIAGGGDPTVGPDGFDVLDITVDGVTQLGIGVTVGTGAPFAVTETIDRIAINRPKGGRIDLKAPNHGTITITGAESLNSIVVLGPESGQTTNRVERLTIQNSVIKAGGSAVSAQNALSSIGTLLVDNVASAGAALISASCVSMERIRVRNNRYTGTDPLLYLGGATVVDSLTIESLTGSFANDRSVLRVEGTANLKRVTVVDSTITGTGVANNHLVYLAQSTAKAGTVNISRSQITGLSRILEVVSGATGNTSLLQISETTLTTLNRILQCGGGVVDFRYSNITLSGTINQPLRYYNSAAGSVMGGGWLGYTTGALAADVGTVRVRADFPADLALLAKNNGDAANNTNTGLASGAGPAVSNGTNWKNVYTAAIY